MNKIFSILIITIVLIVTGLVCAINPQLHKQMMIVGSNYKFVDETVNVVPKLEPSVPQQKNVQKQPPKVEQKKVDNNINKVKPKIQNTVKKVEVQSKINQVKTEKKVEPKKVEKILEQKEKKSPVVDVVLDVKDEQKVEIRPQQPQVVEIKELTEEEEIIAWNKWRSDLQNQVMKDTKISAPIGVTFKFSFTVDKFGNMSNINVWSTTDGYSDIAVYAIKPVLMSYQRQSILNFPKGTKRVITNVAGGFIMSETTGYSSPSDYSDYERVKK